MFTAAQFKSECFCFAGVFFRNAHVCRREWRWGAGLQSMFCFVLLLVSVLINQWWFHNVFFCQQKKPMKTKVTQLLRRASTTSSVPEGKHVNGHLPQESKVSYLKYEYVVLLKDIDLLMQLRWLFLCSQLHNRMMTSIRKASARKTPSRADGQR